MPFGFRESTWPKWDTKKVFTQVYHIDVLIATGYRVKSPQATNFRAWATRTMEGFSIKGYALDEARLKQGQRFGKDYFEELVERIQAIRTSGSCFNKQLVDLFERCSIDYDRDDPIARNFSRSTQNKIYSAVIGKTEMEIISERADATKPNMGLTSWKHAPDGKILESDIEVAKNYLTNSEVKALERIASMYLDYAESLAARQIPMKMEKWIQKLDGFLKLNGYDVLVDEGSVSNEMAKRLTEEQYGRFMNSGENRSGG